MKYVLQSLVLVAAGLSVACFVGCVSMTKPDASIIRAPFGVTRDGKAVDLFTLRNGKGAELQILTYGGIVTSLKVPDKSGKLGDVVLGCDNLNSYATESPF